MNAHAVLSQLRTATPWGAIVLALLSSAIGCGARSDIDLPTGQPAPPPDSGVGGSAGGGAAGEGGSAGTSGFGGTGGLAGAGGQGGSAGFGGHAGFGGLGGAAGAGGLGGDGGEGGYGGFGGHGGDGGSGGDGGLGGHGGSGGHGGFGAHGGSGGHGGLGGYGGSGGHGGPGGYGGSGGHGGFGGHGGDGGAGGCPDGDADGYTSCDNDCNEANALVNPGAFDFVNGIDDDCDGVSDNAVTDCGAGLSYSSNDPYDYAKAIDICQTTTENASGAAKIWGLISAELRLADGTGTPATQSHSIVTQFGNTLVPRHAANFTFLSTGRAATPGQPYWNGDTPQAGTDFGLSSAPPTGFPTNKAGCPLPVTNVAYDPVNIRLRLRTPTNAPSFAVDAGFWSAEYPEYACSVFNDLFVVLVHTTASGLPNNRNIVFDSAGTPASVNLSFYDRCMAGATGCFGTPGFNFCAGGTAELGATGYGTLDPAQPCGAPTTVGGGTGWLTARSPVEPGEIITVELMIWDSSDGIYDSAALIDWFRWQQQSLVGPSVARP